MSVKLFQVFYKDNQPLDSGCIAYDARGMSVSPLFENRHIIDLFEKGAISGADYYGVTSFRMFEKTNLTKKEIDEFIEKHPGYDAYLYGQQGDDDMCLINNKKFSTSIGIAWERLSQLGLLKDGDLINKPWINCFCNYWIANEAVWERYMKYLYKSISLFENDIILEWIMRNVTFPFREKPYPLQCFVLEYLFSLFIKDNPDIKYIQIPNKFSADARVHMPKANDNRSLKKIYENHQAPAGMGDKGTLHNYIDVYEKLFSKYRRESINFLEIGVEQGHSMRMWREYFTNARLIGLDIKHPGCNTTGWWFKQADQSKKEELETSLKGEQFDIIIDDGSHVLEDQITSFKVLFPKMKKGGIYIIEDVGGVSHKVDDEIKILKKELGECEVYDLRNTKGRYDDVLMVWKK